MLRTSLFLVLIALLLTPAVAEEDGARAILAQVIEGMGGDAALAKIQGMRATYVGTYNGMPYTSDMTWVMPHRVVLNIDAGMFQGAMGVDHGVAWTRFMRPVARVRGAARENLLDWRNHQEILLLRPVLHREDVKIERGPGEKTDETTREHVLLTFPGGKKYDLAIRVELGEATLISVTGDLVHMDGRRGSFRLDLAHRADLGGITLPTRTRTRTYIGETLRDDMVETLRSIEWNPPVPDAMFAIPKLDVPLLEPALKAVEPVTGLSVMQDAPPKTMGGPTGKLVELCTDRGYMVSGAIVAVLHDGRGEGAKKSVQVVVPLWIAGAPPVDLPAGVSMVTLPGTRVAALMCRGEYGEADVEGMDVLLKWIGEEKREVIGTPRILFHHDPTITVPEDQLSEIQIPVK